ncbi:hypothetical protein GCM10011411_07460 [Aurantiacibacter arachoides]|nr:hypothetical protein GCM10011411_07460 [Aurantiacibacter arachoides]
MQRFLFRRRENRVERFDTVKNHAVESPPGAMTIMARTAAFYADFARWQSGKRKLIEQLREKTEK